MGSYLGRVGGRDQWAGACGRGRPVSARRLLLSSAGLDALAVSRLLCGRMLTPRQLGTLPAADPLASLATPDRSLHSGSTQRPGSLHYRS